MDIIETIHKQSVEMNNPKSAEYIALKAVEEMGEVARALINPERCDEPISAEIADTIITLIDLHNKIYGDKSMQLLQQDTLNKLLKWKKKYGDKSQVRRL